jgi:urea transport system permease protein
MKIAANLLKLLIGCCAVLVSMPVMAEPAPMTNAAPATTSTPAAANVDPARQQLVQAILSTGADQQAALTRLSTTGSKAASDVLSAWTRDEVYLYAAPGGSKVPVLLEDQQDADGKARAIRVIDGQFLKNAAGQELRFADGDLNAPDADMRLRSTIQQTIDALALADTDRDVRFSAVTKLGHSRKEAYIPILQHRLAVEKSGDVRKAIEEAIASLQLNDPDPAVQTAAVHRLAALQAMGSLDTLTDLQARTQGNPELTGEIKRAVASINAHIGWVNFYGTIFHGLSLGSILLVVALGLAITFGLMGVINMAHGEMIAVGAYTTYVVQNLFGSGFAFHITLPFSIAGTPIGFGLSLPGINATGWFYQSYFVFAIPLSFLMAALAGLVLERSIIQFLYRRPLESLLATGGVSLVMQQMFRMIFGANNVQVNSPNWLLGHFAIDDVSLGYNRVFVIAFAALIVVGTWLLLSKTPLGLLMRAVMQNRAMASCIGVRTTRVNMLTFASVRASPGWPARSSPKSATWAPAWARAISWTAS